MHEDEENREINYEDLNDEFGNVSVSGKEHLLTDLLWMQMKKIRSRIRLRSNDISTRKRGVLTLKEQLRRVQSGTEL